MTSSEKRHQNESIALEIVSYLNGWHKNAYWLFFSIVCLSILSIGGSLFVTTFLGFNIEGKEIQPIVFKIVSFVSAIATAMLTSFNILSRANNLRKAWRTLNYALLKYLNNEIKSDELTKTYNDCEQIIGGITFKLPTANNAIDSGNN